MCVCSALTNGVSVVNINGSEGIRDNNELYISSFCHGRACRGCPEFLRAPGPYVYMNHGTLLGIREKKTHERRRSYRDPRLQQGGVTMEAHVASVCFKCFRRFRGTLQSFHMDVAKVDRGCCTYCKCFRCMLQLFHMDVTKVDQGCCTYCNCFRSMLQVFQRCCSKYFICYKRMLQAF
jgi:hypothetical protein